LCIIILFKHNTSIFIFQFQKGSQKADEYIRMIKDKLDIAVDQCIQAAGHEIEPSKQKQLLRVLVLQTNKYRIMSIL
jgi:hypothetical protein